jgi:hypothetical protein
MIQLDNEVKIRNQQVCQLTWGVAGAGRGWSSDPSLLFLSDFSFTDNTYIVKRKKDGKKERSQKVRKSESQKVGKE